MPQPFASLQAGRAFQRVQQLVGKLLRCSCAAVDAAAGTRFLAEEQEIGATADTALRRVLANSRLHRPHARAAWVQRAAWAAAADIWRLRCVSLLPRLRHATRAGLRGQVEGNAARSTASGRAVAAGAQRDLAVAAAGGCCNPHCARCYTALSMLTWGVERRRCRGCGVARYCRWACWQAGGRARKRGAGRACTPFSWCASTANARCRLLLRGWLHLQ